MDIALISHITDGTGRRFGTCAYLALDGELVLLSKETHCGDGNNGNEGCDNDRDPD